METSTRCMDEAVDLASRTQHPLRAEFHQTRSPFRFAIRHRSLGPLSLSHVTMDYEGRYDVATGTTGDIYHFQLAIRGNSRVVYGRRELGVGRSVGGLLLSPGRPIRWAGEGGFREVTVRVDRRAVEERFGRLSDRAPGGTIEFEPCVDVESGPGARLVGLVETPEAFLDALLLDLPHSHGGHLRSLAAAPSRSLVLHAEKYIEDRYDLPLTIRSVALALGVSIRTLQRSFARHRPYSPKRFLQERRLHRARQALLAGAGSTVTRIAFATGHSHLGQFSVDYRRRFGESPSETLLSRIR